MRRCLRCDGSVDETWRCARCGFAPGSGDFPLFAPELANEGAAFEAVSFDLLPALEESSFWFRARNELVAWALARHFPHAESFLEVGCGTGFVLGGLRERFPRLRLVGGEPFLAGLEVARRRVPDAELVQLDAAALPFREEFDAAGAFDVLEHLDDDEAALAQLREALVPGGGLVVTVPQHRWLWGPADEFAHHRRRYDRRALVERVRRAGFEVVRTTSFVSLLLPLLVASRVAQKRSPRPYDPTEEYRRTQGARRVLETVMAVERAVIGAGVPLPAGGSLLLVGRRR